jgi:hypothetical protein
MMEPVHHPGEPFVKPRRPKPLAVVVFLLIAIVAILAAGWVVVLLWEAVNAPLGGGATKVDRARMDVRMLEQATLFYWSRHNRYPTTLEELTVPQAEGDRTVVEPKALIDPWGNPYFYEPEMRHAGNDFPLIYSNGPPGANKRIRNWD